MFGRQFDDLDGQQKETYKIIFREGLILFKIIEEIKKFNNLKNFRFLGFGYTIMI